MDLKKVQFPISISSYIISPVNLREISLCLVGKGGGINAHKGMYRQRKKHSQSTRFCETLMVPDYYQLQWRFGSCWVPRFLSRSSKAPMWWLWRVQMRWGSSTCPAELVSMSSVTLHRSGGVQPRRDLSCDMSLYNGRGREGRVGTLARLCDKWEEIITFLLFCLEIRTCLGKPGYTADLITTHVWAHNDSNIQWVSNIQ